MSNPHIENPLISSTQWPEYHKIQAVDIKAGVNHLIERAETLLQEIESSSDSSWEDVVEPLEKIDQLFELHWSPVSHLHSVMNTAELRQEYQAVLGDIVNFGLKLQQSQSIYQRLKALKESAEYEDLSPVRKRILKSKLHDAELSGIGLDDQNRAEFNTLAKRLSELSNQFSNHVLDATNAYELIVDDASDTHGMPLSLKQLASQSYRQANPEATSTATDGPWRFTLEAASYGPFMQHCPNPALREQMYREFISRASTGELNNMPLCQEILKLRKQQAQLLGYNTYAEVSLSEKMAPDVDAVWEMIETLRLKSTPAAKDDLDTIHVMAENAGQPIEGQWDYAYWAERMKEERFELTDDLLRPYFQHEIVLQGLFDLVEHLFQIKVVEADGQAPIWHEDVRFFHINNLDGTHIASFYYDPYSRPATKRPGAWMSTCLSKRDGVLPVAHLVCNCTPPVDGKAALMSFREVETLFHEFGHGLQHMLTTVTDSFASGISNVEWDAVELPSQFMEYWCYHKPTLQRMTKHVETGEPIPDDLYEKLVAARTHWAGGMMLRQLVFGSLDLELHDRYDPESGRDLVEVQKEVCERVLPYPMHPEDRTLCSFSHIFAGGYAAGYYSYKWAEVLSADAFAAFEEAGLDDADKVAAVGKRFRETVLSLGGGTHPMEVFKEFRGREPEPDALLRHSGLI